MYDGCIKYGSGAFGPNSFLDASTAREIVINNSFNMYRAHFQQRINTSFSGGYYFHLPAFNDDYQKVMSFGPFPLTVTSGGKPAPLYVRLLLSASVDTEVVCELRSHQNPLRESGPLLSDGYGYFTFLKDDGLFSCEVTGANASINQIGGAPTSLIQGEFIAKKPVQTTFASGVTGSTVSVPMAYLDIWVLRTEDSQFDRFIKFYSVYAREYYLLTSGSQSGFDQNP